MPRLTDEMDAFVKARWGAWLREKLGLAEMSPERLGKLLAPDRGVNSGGSYRAHVRGWLEPDFEKRKSVFPDLAFRVGEVLRASGLPWCSGIVALYAAGYFGDYAALLGTIAREGEDRGVAAVVHLVRAVPLLGSILSVPEDEYFAHFHELAHREARTDALTANDELNLISDGFTANAFEQRFSKITTDTAIKIVREMHVNQGSTAPELESYILVVLNEWARRLWQASRLRDVLMEYDEINDLPIVREAIIAQLKRESESQKQVFTRVEKRALRAKA
jgi:hypothetical protein